MHESARKLPEFAQCSPAKFNYLSVPQSPTLWTAASHRRFARLREPSLECHSCSAVRVHAVAGMEWRLVRIGVCTQSGEARFTAVRKFLWTAASHRRFARLREPSLECHSCPAVRVHAVAGMEWRLVRDGACTQSGEARFTAVRKFLWTAAGHRRFVRLTYHHWKANHPRQFRVPAAGK